MVSSEFAEPGRRFVVARGKTSDEVMKAIREELLAKVVRVREEPGLVFIDPISPVAACGCGCGCAGGDGSGGGGGSG